MVNPDQKPTPARPRFGGGVFLFAGLLIGAVAGVAWNEPSLGMVTGFGIGGLLAILIWLFDRKSGGKGR